MNIDNDNFYNGQLFGPDDHLKYDTGTIACGAFGNSIEEVKENLRNDKIFPCAPQTNSDWSSYYKIDVLDANKEETAAMQLGTSFTTYKYFYLIKYRKDEPRDDDFGSFPHPSLEVKWTQERPMDPPSNVTYYAPIKRKS